MKGISALSGFGTSVAALLAIVSYIPDFWFFSFLAGMRLHLAVFVIIASTLHFAAERQRRFALLIGIGALVFAHSLYLTYAFGFQVDQRKLSNLTPLKIISFNMLGHNDEHEKVADFLISSGADIVVTMESYRMSWHFARLEKIYPYRIGCGELTKICNLLVMSKLPLFDRQVETIGENYPDRFITAKLEWQGKSIRMAAIHLTKPYFGTTYQGELQRAQALLSHGQGPLVLAGDFNSSILATDVQEFMMALGLKVAGSEPNTWPVQGTFLGLPIDHVMAREPLIIRSLHRLDDAMGSNHFGLEAELVLQSQPN